MSVQQKKKSYAAFLIDRPSDGSQLHQGNQGAIITLMNCLRHRLILPADSKKPKPPNQNIESNADGKSSEKSGFLDKYRTRQSSSAAAKKTSLYDTLLQLINEFDATVAAEIFRLLLERRTAIPLFVPDSRKHHLKLFRHITIPGVSTRLGEDQTLFRIAIISCRRRNDSQTTGIMKRVFNVRSVHSEDLSNGSLSSNPFIAEIGVGCLVIEEDNPKTVHQVLVIHVIGDFRPLWKCLQHFANFLLVEDSTVEMERFCSMFPKDSAVARGLDSFPFSCVWTPSTYEMRFEPDDNENEDHLCIEGLLEGPTIHFFKDIVCRALDKPRTTENLLMLYQIPILIDEAFSPLECVSPSEINWSNIQSVRNLSDVKKNDFLLQKNYLEQAKIEVAKVEHRLNKEKVDQFEHEIRKVKETIRSQTVRVQNHPLLQLFLEILKKEDSCSRVLSFGLLENELAKRGEQELEPLLKKVQQLSSSYCEVLKKAVDEPGLDSKLKKDLNSAKTELIDSALNIEHLWRELSHLYTDMDPEKRSPSIQKIPRLAARHLLDGFPLELLDGDSNMIRHDWIKVVLYELGKLVERKRIFVLSVMGVQSSGKSTMLNTMFGIKMRTSVGQCTRGVNMQLLAVEGRAEYDYILLLDTEGTRAPEFHGLPGSEKRDNQMATLSILLSDATIIVIPGENDAAVKEMLPIVLMAYDGSQLAELNGGRLSSMMFFLYNRIDTSQANKLEGIIQTLRNSLHAAFKEVKELTGNSTSNPSSESPFGSFNLGSSSSTAGRDVCILGNVKSKSEPPGDVPDETYGATLIKFREHIHQRVVSNAEGKAWESLTVDKFSAYIKEVWYCICSADFNLNFATVVERTTFDKLDVEYKLKEQELSEAYMKFFTNIKKEMRKVKNDKQNAECAENPTTSSDISNNNNNEDLSVSFIAELNDAMFPILKDLDGEVKVILASKGREKWSVQFLQMWEMNKKKQDEDWKNNMINAFNRIFLYEEHLESYKRKMRQEINEFFKSTSSEITDAEMANLDEKFQVAFEKMLFEIKNKFSSEPIEEKIEKVYEKSHVIKGRQIETNWTLDKWDSNLYLTSLLKEQKKNGNGTGAFNSFQSVWKKWNRNGKSEKDEKDEMAEKQALLYTCVKYVKKIVEIFVDGKMCYDDSIVYTVIQEVDGAITKNNVIDNSTIKQVHAYGRKLITELLEKIQGHWEANNSVYAKFKCSEGIMRNYFELVSKGAAKTKIFASAMANTFSNVLSTAFKEDMVAKSYRKICNERWIHEARIMHKYMDLHLIDLLEDNQIDQVLDYLGHPKQFYACVLLRLIALKVPDVKEEWTRFKSQAKDAVKQAALATLNVNSGLAQTFVNKLRDEFSDGFLQSDALSSAFSIDCTGEYQECDNEDKKKFQEDCENELNQAIDDASFLNEHEKFAEELSPKVVQHLKTLKNQTALPRCDAHCPCCFSLCIEAFDHDTQHRPHDAIHQPGGVVGQHYRGTNELVAKTCSQSYEADHGFYLNKEDTVAKKFRDFSKVYPEWKDPRIYEESPLREYILATYNNKIAGKYDLKPCPDVPASYSRVLSTIKEQLKMDIV